MFSEPDNANQRRSFCFSATAGEFLQMVACFYLCFGFMFSALEYCEPKMENNSTVFGLLFNVLLIYVILMVNSRIVYGIVGVLTLVCVFLQLMYLFVLLCTTPATKLAYPVSTIVIVGLFMMFVLFVVTLLELLSAAAMLQLSGAFGTPPPPAPEPVKKVKSHSCKSVIETESSSERN